ncbi:MAG: MBL fold metallo-hydrolase [Bacteroidota bacterium]
MHRFVLTVLLLSIAGPNWSQTLPHPGEPPPVDTGALEIQYFSVGCLKLKVGDVAVLTDPFWTHLPAARVMLGKLRPDPQQIDPHLPDLRDIEAVLISHGHYDHILDLPYIAPQLPPETVILGSTTSGHLLAPFALKPRFQSVNSTVADTGRAGTPQVTESGRIRIRAIRGQHPNHFWFIHLWGEQITAPLTEPPVWGREFQEGLTLAWLIDFLAEDGGIQYRVFFQSSSAPYPFGYFPEAIRAEHPIDVAILHKWFLDRERKGERSVLRDLGARHVMFCHWEDFFQPKTVPPRRTLLRRLSRKITTLETEGPAGVRYILPEWDGRYYFSPGE